MARKLTDTINLKLRLSEALRRRLEKAAERSDRSMNAEIIYRLEQSFDPPLDLFGIIKKGFAQARMKFGDDRPEHTMATITAPLTAALEQVVPDLHSVEIRIIAKDSTVPDRYWSLSDRAEQLEGGK